MWKEASAVVCVCLSFAIGNMLFKNELNGGMDSLIIIVYMQSTATIFLFSFAFFWERSSWNKLRSSLIREMFLCSLLGLTLGQYFFFMGIQYTSVTFSCAFVNSVPVITFVLAVLLRMEKVNIKSVKGKAKVVGTVVCVAGVLLLSLYKGVALINPRQYSVVVDDEQRVSPNRFGVGAALLAASSLSKSSWFILQTRIGIRFPHGYTSTSIMSLFCSLQSTILFFIISDRNLSKWILRGQLQILTVVFNGVMASGVGYALMSWTVKRRGPVFTAAFSPFVQVFAAVFDALLLHQQIYLGSILGSVVIIVGMYVLLWGKTKDGEVACIERFCQEK